MEGCTFEIPCWRSAVRVELFSSEIVSRTEERGVERELWPLVVVVALQRQGAQSRVSNRDMAAGGSARIALMQGQNVVQLLSVLS